MESTQIVLTAGDTYHCVPIDRLFLIGGRIIDIYIYGGICQRTKCYLYVYTVLRKQFDESIVYSKYSVSALIEVIVQATLNV